MRSSWEGSVSISLHLMLHYHACHHGCATVCPFVLFTPRISTSSFSLHISETARCGRRVIKTSLSELSGKSLRFDSHFLSPSVGIFMSVCVRERERESGSRRSGGLIEVKGGRDRWLH